MFDYTFVNITAKHLNNTITSNIVVNDKNTEKVLESVENNFLVPLSFSYNLCKSVALPLQSFRNLMPDHDESSLVSSVVFGADMWTIIH